jgi:sucrose-6-phosphate hydrolase SacC (GH32 family)
MKWKKLGKIFDPTEHTLPNNCFGFAQSPQTLIFDEFVRIYFSTREKDSTGKFLSHVAYVDFDKDFKKIIKISDRTVIPLGKLGCFDEHGIFPINVLRDNQRILAFTTGWNRKVSVSADASVGLAFSHDNGITFTKHGSGPVLSSSLNEPFLVGDAFVAKFDDHFDMWYIFGTKWIQDPSEAEPQRVYKIAHATSFNGVDWKKDSIAIIQDKLDDNECQALPSVIKNRDIYHMYFCYRHATGFRRSRERGYRIGYAWSKDRTHWIRDDQKSGIDFSEDGWDSEMMCYPHVFHHKEKVWMLYNGNEFGKYGFGLAKLEE